jgi:hypothetical protein
MPLCRRYSRFCWGPTMFSALLILAFMNYGQAGPPGPTSSQAQEQTLPEEPPTASPAPSTPAPGLMTGYDPHPHVQQPLNAASGYSPTSTTYSVHATSGYLGASRPRPTKSPELYKSAGRPQSPPLSLSQQKRAQPKPITLIDVRGQAWTFDKSSGLWINDRSGVRRYDEPK